MAGTDWDDEVRNSMAPGPQRVDSPGRPSKSFCLRHSSGRDHSCRVSPDDEPVGPATGMCVDGPMAGTEVRVSLDADGEPAAVVDVGGRAYALAMQDRPVTGRPWRYSVVRDGDLYVIDGGASTP